MCLSNTFPLYKDILVTNGFIIYQALLEDYEIDMISCLQEEFPSVVVFNYDNKLVIYYLLLSVPIVKPMK